jgi:5-methylcytosine-specific restriction endonuclease McrA
MNNNRLSRLDRDAYGELHRAVLERDGWRCQICGERRGLEVHHIRFRSRGGGNREENLITLCSECHTRVHGRQ